MDLYIKKTTFASVNNKNRIILKLNHYGSRNL